MSPFIFRDPLHGHSFHLLLLSDLTPVQHSLLFFRECSVCSLRLIALTKQSEQHRLLGVHKRRVLIAKATNQEEKVIAVTKNIYKLSQRSLSKTNSNKNNEIENRKRTSLQVQSQANRICQCLLCGAFVHRECLSYVHVHRYCPSEKHAKMITFCAVQDMPVVDMHSYIFPIKKGDNTTATPLNSTQQEEKFRKLTCSGDKNEKSAELTLSEVIDALTLGIPETSNEKDVENQKEDNKTGMLRRAAPYVAATGVLGAATLAMGPIAPALATLNVFISSLSGAEAMAVAGLSLTAAAAAVSSNKRKKIGGVNKKRMGNLIQPLSTDQQEKANREAGKWAMAIWWECQRSYHQSGKADSDAHFRQDAAFIRRFHELQANLEVDTTERDNLANEVFEFLFHLFASRDEFLSQLNSRLCDSFHQRYNSRLAQNEGYAQSIASTTVHDARMYLAHLLGATIQRFPSLVSTDDALILSTKSIERIIFADIYNIVLNQMRILFDQEYRSLKVSVTYMRQHQQLFPLLKLLHKANGDESLQLHSSLLEAEQFILVMMENTTSPICKLEILCHAFRHIASFADNLHQTASHADILIPIVATLLAASHAIVCSGHEEQDSKTLNKNFVAEIAFIAFFTHGGGKGIEGYVLTTFQAAIQVLCAVDMTTNSTVQELAIYQKRKVSYSSDDDAMFFDAVESDVVEDRGSYP